MLKIRLEKYSHEAHLFYQRALELSESNLRAKNTLRLGVALNFSVFNYEILNNPNAAFNIAKKAFDMCLEDLSINNKVNHSLSFSNQISKKKFIRKIEFPSFSDFQKK